MKRFALLLLVALAAVATASGAAPKTTLVGDCVHSQVKPSKVIFTCADGTFFATGLRWTHWGSRKAQATGTAHFNNCKPSCAQGHFKRYAVKLIASHRRTCADGNRAYTRVRYSFPRKSPFRAGSPQARHPVVSFPCR
jgi:hypothetical protein